MDESLKILEQSLDNLLPNVSASFYKSRPSLKSNKHIFFYHVPKTGGMTLYSAVKLAADGYRKVKELPLGPVVFKFDSDKYIQDFQNHHFNDSTMFVSHMNFGAHQRLNRPFQLATTLRDPFSRLVSHFGYDNMRANKKPETQSFEKMMLEQSHQNVICKQLAPKDWETENTIEYAERVFDHIQQQFDYYFTIEHLDTAVQYFLSAMGLSNVLSEKINVTTGQFKLDLENYREQFSSLNIADNHLYKLVKERPSETPQMSKNEDFSELTTFLYEFNKSSQSETKSITTMSSELEKYLKQILPRLNGKKLSMANIFS